MAGWSTVARLPFTPLRAVEEMHASIAGPHNFSSCTLFFLLSTSLYALYTAHLAWVRVPQGTFLAGFGVLFTSVLISTFVYVLAADILCDAGRGRKLILPLLLSTFAISGAFSLLSAAVYEAGVLGLWKVHRALAIGLAAVILWQGIVEGANLRRIYGRSWLRSAVGEVVARAAGLSMALGFVGFMSGVTRPWQHWRKILWVFGAV